MDPEFDFFKTTMTGTRTADYYLGCLDSCVYIDFAKTGNGRISLVRISFDGFGCCQVGEAATALNLVDSQQFIAEIAKDPLNQQAITPLVLRLIQLNRQHIWPDALERYGLT